MIFFFSLGSEITQDHLHVHVHAQLIILLKCALMQKMQQQKTTCVIQCTYRYMYMPTVHCTCVH